MPILKSCVTLAAGPALVMLACAASFASMIKVEARVSFVQPIQVGKQSDVTFGELQTRPRDRVSLDADGNMRLHGTGELLAPSGRPGVINLGDARNQVLNFVPGNYATGQGIASLQAHCIVEGNAETGDCDSLPIFVNQRSTLFIGMDMTVADGIATTFDNRAAPSFDLAIVYQ
jgi:hypothetical protein